MFANRVINLLYKTVGVYLLLAAVGKALRFGPSTAVLQFDGIYNESVQLAIIVSASLVESSLGIAILLGVFQRTVAILTIILFSLFTIQHVLLAVLHGPACGCFGKFSWLFPEQHRDGLYLNSAIVAFCILVYRYKASTPTGRLPAPDVLE